eukprot:5163805-Alexandrium_andersonii.AAC.1
MQVHCAGTRVRSRRHDGDGSAYGAQWRKHVEQPMQMSGFIDANVRARGSESRSESGSGSGSESRSESEGAQSGC